MPTGTEAIRDLVDNWASTYDADGDRQDQTDVLKGYQESLRRAADLLLPMVTARVLDIGIGTGLFAELVAPKDAEIHDIDISRKCSPSAAASTPISR